MIYLAAALFAFNACVSFFVGWRSFRRAEFPSYQVKAAGKSLDQLSPGVRTVVSSMFKTIAGGFLAYGVATLALCIELLRGSHLAPFGLLIAAAALLGPVTFAMREVEAFRPDCGAPTRLAYTTATIALVAFIVALLG
jgi:hypothetical protein